MRIGFIGVGSIGRPMAGLIAKYGKIDAIVSDYGVTTLAAGSDSEARIK